MSAYVDDLTWVAVDTETTGTNPYLYEIVEIGAVRFSLKTIEGRFHTLIKTTKKHHPGARAIHNITEKEEKEKGIPIEDALKNFLIFIRDDPLIFHNASFDIAFLIKAMNDNQIKAPENYYYDNLFISRTYFSERKRHSLEYLRELFNINTGKPHRALSDAEATALVFRESLNKKYDLLDTKKNYNSFLRYHRKFHKFKFTLPKNLDKVEQYFNHYIKTKKALNIFYIDQNDKEINIKGIPQDIMIFNQNIFIKMSSIFESDQLLIPLKSAIIYDPDKGELKLEDFK